MPTLAHLSDLHLGRSQQTLRAAEALCALLVASHIDHVVVSGDVTHRGLDEELELFRRSFGPLLRSRRLTVVPGNHDRLNEDAAQHMMLNERVQIVGRHDLYLVNVDSTGPHNRSIFRGHGELRLSDLNAITGALDGAPRGALTALILHHHPLPLPEEHFTERLSSFLGWPFAAELASGPPLIQRILGRCDLVLHGHRHVPSARVLEGSRPLHIYNAGSSTELGRFRLFTHRDGALVGKPVWAQVRPSAASAALTAGRSAIRA